MPESEFQLKKETLVSTIESYEQLTKDLAAYKEEQQLIIDSVKVWDSELSQTFRDSYSKMLADRYTQLEEKCQKIKEILLTALSETNRLLNRRDGFADTFENVMMTAGVGDILNVTLYSTERVSGGILKLNDSLKQNVINSCDHVLELVQKENIELGNLKSTLKNYSDISEDLRQLEIYINRQKNIEDFKHSFEQYCKGVELLDSYLTDEFGKITEEYGECLDSITYKEVRESTINKKTEKMVAAYKNILVTKEMIETFKWVEMTDAEVQKLNYILNMYDITTPESIALFMATCAAETTYGSKILEVGDEEYCKGNGYDKSERGVGYIQFTHRTSHLEFLKYMKDSYNGQETAEYIAENYDPWEVSAYVWSVMEHGEGVFLNNYVAEYGGSIEVFLVTQYFINSYKNGIDNALRGIREGSINYSIDLQNNKLIPDGYSPFDLPDRWKERDEAYKNAVQVFM